MNIIIDTSVLVGSITKQSIRKEITQKSIGYNLYAPESVIWEIGNAISLMFKKKTANLNQALLLLHEFRKIHIEYIPINLDDAIRLCYNHDIYAYDAYILQATLEYGYPLLSLDKRQVSIAQKLNVKIIGL